jgi:hypothetical protein
MRFLIAHDRSVPYRRCHCTLAVAKTHKIIDFQFLCMANYHSVVRYPFFHFYFRLLHDSKNLWSFRITVASTTYRKNSIHHLLFLERLLSTKPPRQSHGGAGLSQHRMRGPQNSACGLAIAHLAITTNK